MDVEVLSAVPDDLDGSQPAVLILGPGAGEGDPGSVLRALPDADSILSLVLIEAGDLDAAVEAGRVGATEVLSADAPPGRLATIVRSLMERAEAAWRCKDLEEVRRRYKELESLVFLISHDLKTPLVSIQGISTILLEGRSDEEKTEQYIQRIQANAERIEDLVRDLLEFPKIGRLVGLPETVDMQEAARRAIDGLAQQIEESGARIEVDPDLPVVKGDRKRLQQVLHNLIHNAIKYGGEPAQIRVGHTESNGEQTFFVEDHGEGISPENLEKAFHLFRRLDNVKPDRNGMGIGLAVTRRIIEGHGGRIWARSERGKGTTFFFSLPSPDDVALSDT